MDPQFLHNTNTNNHNHNHTFTFTPIPSCSGPAAHRLAARKQLANSCCLLCLSTWQSTFSTHCPPQTKTAINSH